MRKNRENPILAYSKEPQASEAADVAIQQLLDRDLTENEDEAS